MRPTSKPYPPIVVLCQALKSPTRRGVRRPEKPTGYVDSGADIAFALRRQGFDVRTPVSKPSPENERDWVFLDDPRGFQTALQSGAGILWANTTLFAGHPIECLASSWRIVGQTPQCADQFDDKWIANQALRKAGCQVAVSLLVSLADSADGLPLVELRQRGALHDGSLKFPVVAKPVRGRGSEGVCVIGDERELHNYVAGEMSFDRRRHGDAILLEEFLPGDEITVTVFPPGRLYSEPALSRGEYWSLPPVRRFAHIDQIAPYSGETPVAENSQAITSPDELEKVRRIIRDCEVAARIVGARAPIRIDCRAGETGAYKIFDVNLKPNLAGPGRPGRDNQLSLVGIAAQGLGWTYEDLVANMLMLNWPCSGGLAGY